MPGILQNAEEKTEELEKMLTNLFAIPPDSQVSQIFLWNYTVDSWGVTWQVEECRLEARILSHSRLCFRYIYRRNKLCIYSRMSSPRGDYLAQVLLQNFQNFFLLLK